MNGSLENDFIARLLASPLFCQNIAIELTGAEILYPAEFRDMYSQLEPSEKKRLVPIFDQEFYQSQYPDVESGDLEPLSHFFGTGFRELRSPHPLIDCEFMSQLRPDLVGQDLTPNRFMKLLEQNLIDPSPFFDSTFYSNEVGLDVSQDSALGHFLAEGAHRAFNPSRLVDIRFYKSKYKDVPDDPLDALYHFILQGDAERRLIGLEFDPDWYVSYYGNTNGVPPLMHYLKFGRYAGRSPRGEHSPQVSAEGVAVSFQLKEWIPAEDPLMIKRKFESLNEAYSRARQSRIESYEPSTPESYDQSPVSIDDLFFPEVEYADIDVVIPCFDQFDLTLECLRSLQAQSGTFSFRIIIADDASPDERMSKLANVPGITYTRQKTNQHFLRNCNAAYQECTAPFILLLNDDACLLPGSLEILFEALSSDESISAVSPKFLYPNGRLQEAGGSLNKDGSTGLVGVGDDPDIGGYNRRRDVEYGSAACLLVRRVDIGDQLFDPLFAPAYCEDLDLCFRLGEAGKRIVYVPEAQVIHQLSATTSRASEKRRVQRAKINQSKFYEKWEHELSVRRRARVLAFYLPQFHPLKQNNYWWGEGFTEWTNVSKALPGYEGHYQPHLPADLGFYDLRLTEVLGKQQELARRYGVEGFVVYYYNFGGTRIMEAPINTLQKDPGIDFQYCYCWANENWTKHWDGGEKSPLLTQQYDDRTLAGIVDDFIKAARDARYITVNGKPMFMIYRPLLIPNVENSVAQIRERFLKETGQEIHFVYVESMEAVKANVDPKKMGFDAAVEFPPQGIAEKYKKPVQSVRKWDGQLYDYPGTAMNASMRDLPNYKRYPAVFPSWDNTARQPVAGTVLHGASPELFESFVGWKLQEINDFFVGDERLLFVNAWNEWAEGAHLEPDRAYGHRWLNAIRNALLKNGMFPA